MQIPNDIKELSRKKALAYHAIIKTPMPDTIKPGQIWSTYESFELPGSLHFTTDEPRIVVILVGDGTLLHSLEQIIVSPISINTKMASDRDFIIKKEFSNSPLNFDFMVEIWNETPVLKGQLKQYLGSLTDLAINYLYELYMAHLQNKDISRKLREWIGVLIVSENDPRLEFQDDEIKAVSYLAKAATAALEISIEETSAVNLLEKNWIVFNLQPIFMKPAGFISRKSVAQAASSLADESESCFIHRSSTKDGFTLELLNRHKYPYTIYFKVCNLSHNLLERPCIITVKTQITILKSDVIKLEKDITIEVGEDPQFHCDDVQIVEVAIEGD